MFVGYGTTFSNAKPYVRSNDDDRYVKGSLFLSIFLVYCICINVKILRRSTLLYKAMILCYDKNCCKRGIPRFT